MISDPQRDARRAFSAGAEAWHVDTHGRRSEAGAFEKAVAAEDERAAAVMVVMPHVLPFQQRVVLFRKWVDAERRLCAARKVHKDPCCRFL